MSTLGLAIKEPCHNRYENMHEGNHGRFCNDCKTIVVDFTKFSNTELLAYFKNQDNRVCGRFAPFQLEQALFIPETKSSWRNKALVVIASSLAFFSTQQVSAAKPKEKGNATYQGLRSGNNKEIHLGADTTHISGVVVAADDNLPIAGATIRIKGSQQVAISNEKGEFNFSLPNSNTSNLILEAISIGYLRETYKIRAGAPVHIKLSLDNCVMGEVIVVQRNTDSNLFLQLFHRLRRLFR